MSRIGRLIITIPKGVTVKQEGNAVLVEGPKGKAQHPLPPRIGITIADGTATVTREADDRKTRALHGLTRKLIANSTIGLSTGFQQTLEIVGVGYRAEVKGKAVQFSLGYSHPIVYQLPPGIEAKVDRQVVVTLEGNDKQLLGEVSAQIRALRPPEPYKGKGVKYADERIRRKAGKAAGAGGR
ncbi:50S ribosomal protein L6 [bacterium]|nr:50S ribosomal protein L6 [bacterium]